MSNTRLDKIDEVFAKIRDWLQAGTELREMIDNYLSQELEALNHPETWNPSSITWTEAEGSKGRYLKAAKQESSDYAKMVADLKTHKGKLTKSNEFFWLFDDNEFVGRKIINKR